MTDKAHPYDPMLAQWEAAGRRGKSDWTPRKEIEASGGTIQAPDEHTLLVTVDSAFDRGRPIGPDEERTLQFSGHAPWRAKSFSVPEELCRHFSITGLRCARVEYIPNEAIPCALFSTAICVLCRKQRVADFLTTDWPVVFPGTTLSLTVRNTSDVSAHFRGIFEAEHASIEKSPLYGSCL